MNRCILLRVLSRACCFLFCGICFFVGKQACAQKVATYLLDTAPDNVESAESYRISVSTSSKAFTVSFPLGGRHAFNVRAEYFRTASLPKLNEKIWDIKADWKFRSVPVTVSYTYALPGPDTRVVPVVGAGLSAHFFKETKQVNATSSMFSYSAGNGLMGFESGHRDRFGLKYGAELSLGLRTQITSHLFLMAQGRYRYINCSVNSMIYGSGSGHVNVLDFSLDIGFGF